MAATAAPEKRTFSVPVDMRTEDETKGGLITYNYTTPSDPVGLFSLTWYFRHEPIETNRNVKTNTRGDRLQVYLLGLMNYIHCTEQPRFAGWKVVIYTDQHTLDDIQLIEDVYPGHYATAQALFNHPNLIVAVCSWPEYYTGRKFSPNGDAHQSKKIDGIILRMFRNRAFCDFHTLPVFVRDADTVFSILPSGRVYDRFEPQRNIVKKVEIWEHALLVNLQNSGKRFLVASNIQYRQGWHYNKQTQLYTMGFLAGLTTSLGGLPEWDPTNPDNLWIQSIDFVRGRSTVINNPPYRQLSNLREYTYVGKDEQIISFVWLPAIADRTFFFYESVLSHNRPVKNILELWNNPPENRSQQNQMYFDSLKGFLQTIAESLPGRVIPLENINSSPMSKYTRIRNVVTRRIPESRETNTNYEKELLKAKYNELKKTGQIRLDFNFSTNLEPYAPTHTLLFSENPFFINEAFRDPFYDTVLRTVWTYLNRAYQAKKSTGRQGGRRRTQKQKGRRRRHAITRRR